MGRYSKQDWIQAGMQTLAKQGESALRIEHLCTILKVSKGSFYHHFQHIDDYISQLMQFWEKENTLNIIEETEKGSTLKQKAEKLNQLVLEKDQKLEVVIRAWGVRDARIRRFVDEIDQQRITFLQKLYLEQGFPEVQALDYARIEYGSFVGMQHLFRNLPLQEWQRLFLVFQQLINPKPN